LSATSLSSRSAIPSLSCLRSELHRYSGAEIPSLSGRVDVRTFRSKLHRSLGAKIPIRSERADAHFASRMGLRDLPFPLSTCPTKPFRINSHFAQFWRHLSSFRINTFKSVSKQRTLSTFRMNTFEKRGRGWPVIVNQISDEEICPEEHRDDRRFRPCRKGPLLESDKDSCPEESAAALAPSESPFGIDRFRRELPRVSQPHSNRPIDTKPILISHNRTFCAEFLAFSNFRGPPTSWFPNCS
jgi:hypothetical protein